jgi:hypothetical protein
MIPADVSSAIKRASRIALHYNLECVQASIMELRNP